MIRRSHFSDHPDQNTVIELLTWKRVKAATKFFVHGDSNCIDMRIDMLIARLAC